MPLMARAVFIILLEVDPYNISLPSHMYSRVV